jgi:cytochrome c-type biogenesis protein CcmH/NrfF
MELGLWVAPVAAVVIVGLRTIVAYYTRPRRRTARKRERDF